MNQWVCRQVVLPQVAKAHHRNDTNTPRTATESHPHPTKPRKSSGVTIVGPTTAIATHTTSQSRCVPFSGPHVPKVARSTDTRQECTNSSAKTMGTSPPSGGGGGHTMPTRSPKEGKRRGYISKGFCAKTDLCPLASPRVALVGVCLLRHPDKGNTR